MLTVPPAFVDATVRREGDTGRRWIRDGRTIHAITAALAPYRYDRICGGFNHIDTDARRIVADSFSRYPAG